MAVLNYPYTEKRDEIQANTLLREIQQLLPHQEVEQVIKNSQELSLKDIAEEMQRLAV